MGFIFAIKSKGTGRVKIVGNTLNVLTLLVTISKAIVEKVSKEKGISMEEAENFVVESIADGMKTIISK